MTQKRARANHGRVGRIVANRIEIRQNQTPRDPSTRLEHVNNFKLKINRPRCG
jgi:hypothetical protein